MAFTFKPATKVTELSLTSHEAFDQWREAVLAARAEYERMLAEVGHPAAPPAQKVRHPAGATPEQLAALKGLAELDAALKTQGLNRSARRGQLLDLAHRNAHRFGGNVEALIGAVLSHTDERID